MWGCGQSPHSGPTLVVDLFSVDSLILTISKKMSPRSRESLILLVGKICLFSLFQVRDEETYSNGVRPC
jgi:hypothetical protein